MSSKVIKKIKSQHRKKTSPILVLASSLPQLNYNTAEMGSEDSKIQGGCHCGVIKYELRINSPDKLEASRCNCTFCTKPGITGYSVSNPSADFKLLSPRDCSTLGNYQPNTKTVNKWFCKECGTHVYQEGEYEYEGQAVQFFSVNLQTVNQPQEGLDLSTVRLRYWDGLHDNWQAGQKDTPWSGGLL